MLRRLLAVLAMLVMLHLTFVGADVACAEQGHHRAMAGMSGAPASDAAQEHRAHPDSSQSPCDTPAAAHCCDGLASCGMAALAASPGETVSIVAAERALAPATQHLLSRALGPEPPPPRA
ncbi:MAG TPA: hypothetical protein VF761_01915 [Gemmatimonadaceae bacterium]